MKPPPDDLDQHEGKWFFVTVVDGVDRYATLCDPWRLRRHFYDDGQLNVEFDRGEESAALEFTWPHIVAMTPEKVGSFHKEHEA